MYMRWQKHWLAPEYTTHKCAAAHKVTINDDYF